MDSMMRWRHEVLTLRSPNLPPLVEEAYRRKCLQLKRQVNEKEEENDAMRLRIIRLQQGVERLRLERSMMLRKLSSNTDTTKTKPTNMAEGAEGNDMLEAQDDEEKQEEKEDYYLEVAVNEKNDATEEKLDDATRDEEAIGDEGGPGAPAAADGTNATRKSTVSGSQNLWTNDDTALLIKLRVQGKSFQTISVRWQICRPARCYNIHWQPSLSA